LKALWDQIGPEQRYHILLATQFSTATPPRAQETGSKLEVLEAVAGDNYRVVIAFAPHLDVMARNVEIHDIGTVPYSIDIQEVN
jgi:hypothetical protein